MRLDHVSYVASHDQISDVVNRIGSQIGTAFVDGGIHPKFGTRNFTAPLLNGQYIEIVCPLDHPATDATPFGQAVKKKADAGGWISMNHPSKDGSPNAKLSKIVMNGELKDLNPKFSDSFSEILQEIEIVWQGTLESNLDTGINFIEITTRDKTIELF